MREDRCNCRPGLSQVPGSEFRVPSWPRTRNTGPEIRNRCRGTFLFAPSRSSALRGGLSPRCGGALMPARATGRITRDTNCTNSEGLETSPNPTGSNSIKPDQTQPHSSPIKLKPNQAGSSLIKVDQASGRGERGGRSSKCCRGGARAAGVSFSAARRKLVCDAPDPIRAAGRWFKRFAKNFWPQSPAGC